MRSVWSPIAASARSRPVIGSKWDGLTLKRAIRTIRKRQAVAILVFLMR